MTSARGLVRDEQWERQREHRLGRRTVYGYGKVRYRHYKMGNVLGRFRTLDRNVWGRCG